MGFKFTNSINFIYIKDKEIFNDILKNEPNCFGSKVVITDNKELSKICYIKGIINVINSSKSNKQFIKDTDCIILSEQNKEIEHFIVENGLKLLLIYYKNYDDFSIWCPICYTTHKSNSLNMYCSEKCMTKAVGFDTNLKATALSDLKNFSSILYSNKNISKDAVIIRNLTDNTSSNKLSSTKKSEDKFQTSVVKDAVRLEYAMKREAYKKEMRQPSHRRASLSNTRESSNTQSKISDQKNVIKTDKICKGITQKGKKCTNKALSNSDYCGILSHSMSEVKITNQ